MSHAQRQFVVYTLIGGFATALHYATMASLLHFDWSPVAASTAGAIAGAGLAYAANCRWTFNKQHRHAQLLRFLMVAALGLLLNALFLLIIHRWLVSSLAVAQIITTALVFLGTFKLNQKWSFA